MQERTTKCAFCKGTGQHPHFQQGCPVCKGVGNIQIVGKYMTCQECHGSGQKRGTTLTCYTCTGLGCIPDVREELKEARQELSKAHGMIEEERARL